MDAGSCILIHRALWHLVNVFRLGQEFDEQFWESQGQKQQLDKGIKAPSSETTAILSLQTHGVFDTVFSSSGPLSDFLSLAQSFDRFVRLPWKPSTEGFARCRPGR